MLQLEINVFDPLICLFARYRCSHSNNKGGWAGNKAYRIGKNFQKAVKDLASPLEVSLMFCIGNEFEPGVGIDGISLDALAEVGEPREGRLRARGSAGSWLARGEQGLSLNM
jgi:hypothetical protein